jgi:large subunit ribosomal protein L4
MIEVPVYNQQGEQIESIQIDPAKLGGEVRPALLKQAVVMYHANKRQGSVKTKNRGEVSGSTKKMYRQKGTGNARMGTKRNPIRRGGGHAHQKVPRDFDQRMPKQQRRLAARNALLSKLQSGEVKVVDGIKLDEPKTKLMAAVMGKLGIDGSVLYCRNEQEFGDVGLYRASRNLPKTYLTTTRQLNAGDLLNRRTLLISKAGLTEFVNGTADTTAAA